MREAKSSRILYHHLQIRKYETAPMGWKGTIMVTIIDNSFKLKPHKEYYRIEDIRRITGMTEQEISDAMNAGTFPQYIPIFYPMWAKGLIDSHLNAEEAIKCMTR